MAKRDKKRLYSFKMPPSMAEALKAVKARDGTRESVQIRTGIQMYLKSVGVEPVVSYEMKKKSNRQRTTSAKPSSTRSRKK